MKTPVAKIDYIIQSERIAADKSKITYREKLKSLPDGVFVSINNRPYLLKDTKMYLWSPGGYAKPVDFAGVEIADVLTPRSFVNMFNAGYQPQMGV